MIRVALKAAAERLVGIGPINRLGRQRYRRRVLVLAYHNIVPDGSPGIGDRSLHLPVSQFIAQVNRLALTHEILSLDQALAKRETTRPRAVITFDDAYKGAIVLGIGALTRLGLPATVFVAPGLLGTRGFWWDRFAPKNGWTPSVRNALLTQLAGADSQVADWAAHNGLRERAVDEWLRPATANELENATGPGITFGSHSWNHPNLTALSRSEVESQLDDSMRWLERLPQAIRWIAYPYGLSNQSVRQVVAARGFSGGLAVHGGWWPAAVTDPFGLPRWNVPAAISIAGFEARAAGYWCR